jgi:SAM-dependent methyltransferase
LNTLPHSPTDLQQLYASRFAGKSVYRKRVWRVLCSFLGRWIPAEASVLDLGCGHCEFINAVQCGRKFGMDLNPDAARFAESNVTIIQQDCSESWKIAAESLDVVFTSNFFEHLPTKHALERTLQQARQALRAGGHLIAMGPNVRYLPGAYWDFFDHYIPLTELSLTEVLTKGCFEIEYCRDRFLPYTMSDGKEYPILALRAYLELPLAWRIFGKQFLVVASKPPAGA